MHVQGLSQSRSMPEGRNCVNLRLVALYMFSAERDFEHVAILFQCSQPPCNRQYSSTVSNLPVSSLYMYCINIGVTLLASHWAAWLVLHWREFVTQSIFEQRCLALHRLLAFWHQGVTYSRVIKAMRTSSSSYTYMPSEALQGIL